MLGIASGDFHCGAISGITPPSWQSEEYEMFQPLLWDWFMYEVGRLGPLDFALFNGDMTHGEGKKDRLGIITQDTYEQAQMAIETIKQINAKQNIFTYGTPFHSVGSYSYEEPIAEYFDASIKDTQLIRLGNALVHMRHVVGRSDTPYGQGTQLHKEVVRDLLQSVEREYEPATYYLRGHAHYHFKVGRAGREAEICPCLELPGSVFGRKMRSQYYDVGFLVIHVDTEGDLTTIPKIMPLRVVHRRDVINVGQQCRVPGGRQDGRDSAENGESSGSLLPGGSQMDQGDGLPSLEVLAGKDQSPSCQDPGCGYIDLSRKV